MRVKLPDFKEKKALFDYLVTNKKQLIRQKSSMPIKSEGIFSTPSIITSGSKDIFSAKSGLLSDGEILPDGVLRAKVVANAANFVDSHKDLILPDAPKKSIKERKGLIPMLHDHIHETTAEIGDVLDILLLDYAVRELGYNADGSTQGLTFIVDIRKDYNEKIYERYKSGRARQHSIGLRYLKMQLAVNSQDYPEELANFDKYYDQIINKEVVDQSGYYWVVSEYMLIENSVVLFGSNPYTPTAEIATSDDYEPLKSIDTQTKEPLRDTRKEKRIQALNNLLAQF